MSFSISKFAIDSKANMLDVELLVNYLSTFSEISFDKYVDTKFYDDICFKILPDVVLKIAKVKKEDYIKIVDEMKVKGNWSIIAKNVLNVLEKNKSLFALSEVISHGMTYFDSIEKNNLLIEEIKLSMKIKKHENTKIKSNQIVQIILDNCKLEYLVNLILNNSNHTLIFTPIHGDRCAISCFILLSLLHKEDSSTKYQMRFISPDNYNIDAELIIATEKWVIQNDSLISHQQNLNINLNNKYSCFLVLNDCDIHCAVINYLNSLGNWSVISERPKVCLIQENIYEKFINILKEELEKSKETHLFDKNRRLSLTYLENGNSIIELLKADANIKLLAPNEILKDQHEFYFPFILDNVQPQDDIFQNQSYNNICSFLLTFRSYEEGLLLANKLYRKKSCVYLWTENLSLCFDLKSKLEYDNIYVNMINISQLLSPINYNIKCDASILTHNSFDSNHFLSANQVSLVLESFKGRSEDPDRFLQIHDVIDKVVADKLISSKSAEIFETYLNNRILNSSNYNSIGALHILLNQMPVGNIILYFGNIDVNDYAIQLILLSWLLGNNVLVISAKHFQHVSDSLIDSHRMKSLAFVNGVTSIRELNNCLVDSVIAFDRLVSNGSETLVDLNFLYLDTKVNKSSEDCDALFDEVLDFIGKKKAMFILGGGINTL